VEASSSSVKHGGGRSLKGMASSREGSLVLAIVAALLAGGLLLAFVNGYRDDVNKDSAATSVFVARSLIPRGTSADIIAAESRLQRTSVRGDDVRSGAITDPTAIEGKVTTTDIAPGQQITAADFARTDNGVLSKISGVDRAVAVPVDSTHGNLGQIRAGDRVDVLVGIGGGGGAGRASQPTLRTLMQNVMVLKAPGSGGGGGVGGGASNVVLRVSDRSAVDLAFAADNGKIWLILRPPAGSRQSPKTAATFDTLGQRGGGGR